VTINPSDLGRIKKENLMKLRYAGLLLILGLGLCGFTCNNSTKNLATASDAMAHALLNAQTAAQAAEKAGVMTPADYAAFDAELSNVSIAGQTLDAAIRNNQPNTSIAQQVTAFLAAFNTLQQQGVAGIKDANTKLEISTIITGAEASIAIIAAEVGTK
jgi:hypothetical protein